MDSDELTPIIHMCPMTLNLRIRIESHHRASDRDSNTVLFTLQSNYIRHILLTTAQELLLSPALDESLDFCAALLTLPSHG